MRFYGQEKLMRELDILTQALKEGEDINILLRAPSGFGKTTLGLLILCELGLDNSYIYLPENGILSPDFNPERRFHFIDEVHLLETPENIYSLLDRKDYSFILATNESGKLKEPLINRCVQLIFQPYSNAELVDIAAFRLQTLNFPLEFLEAIVERSKGNPRVLKILCDRISFYSRYVKKPETVDELIEVMYEVFGISDGGLTELDQIYLDFLRSTDRASLNLISNVTGIDKYTIQNEIEPNLVRLNLLRITSRGRIFNG